MLVREQMGNSVYVVLPLSEQTTSLDKVSIMMINNNQRSEIGLAPISFDGKNDSYSRMMFDVTGKVTLSEYISKNITQNDFKMMLTNLIDALENFDEVMIDVKQVILQLDSVFINVIDHSVSFLCVAIKGRTQNGSLVSFFRELVEKSYITDEAGYFNRVYNLVHTENGFSLQNLRAAMNESTPSSIVEKQSIHQSEIATPVQPKKLEEPETITVSSAPSVQQSIAPIQPPEQEEKKKGLFGGLFSKKKKSDSSPTGYQDGLAGLINGSKSPTVTHESVSPTETHTQIRTPQQFPSQGSGQFDFGGTTVLSGGMANAEKTPAKSADAPRTTPEVSQPMGTTVLNTSPIPQNGYVGTTVLNPGMKNSPGTTVLNPQPTEKAAIIRIRSRERFIISKFPFTIGRDTPGIDCDIHDNTNVGHKHACIIQRDSAFFVIDRNSTNHTYLNGQMITAGEETPLSDGDKLKFADEEFIFSIIII